MPGQALEVFTVPHINPLDSTGPLWILRDSCGLQWTSIPIYLYGNPYNILGLDWSPGNNKNAPLRARFWHSLTSSRRDATNRPHMGSVHRVSSILLSNNQNCAHVGTVLVSLPSSKGGVSPEHRNAPFRARFDVWPPFTTENVPEIARFRWWMASQIPFHSLL